MPLSAALVLAVVGVVVKTLVGVLETAVLTSADVLTDPLPPSTDWLGAVLVEELGAVLSSDVVLVLELVLELVLVLESETVLASADVLADLLPPATDWLGTELAGVLSPDVAKLLAVLGLRTEQHKPQGSKQNTPVGQTLSLAEHLT